MEVPFLHTLGEWASQNPLLLLLGCGAVPVVAVLVAALLGGFRREERAAPPVAARETPERAVATEVPAPPGADVAAPVAVPEPAGAPEPEPAPAPAPEPVRREPVRLRDRLRGTSDALVGRLGSLLSGRTLDAERIEELELLLFGADLGVRTAESLLERVRKEAAGRDAETVRRVLHDAIQEKLQRVESAGGLSVRAHPHVILVLGVNGSGKTTTIGKLAARYKAEGHSVILGAGDTFRAAAIEQLQAWGERVGCEVVAGRPGGDPSAVAFDTVKAAVARGADVAIIDTAGRLQTKKPLMEELGKMVRVIGRDVAGAPHETLLVLDANTGQNAISQARLFTEVADVTGIVLTKLDGTAKGGVIVGLADEFEIPVKHVGVGETVEDLRDFSAEEFVDALFAQ
jgi:fused signal recognition particle receptor